MTAPSYTTDLTIVNDAESGTWAELTGFTQGSAITAPDTDYFIQGAGCASQATGGKTGLAVGMAYDNVTDLAAGWVADDVFLTWMVFLGGNSIDTWENGGQRFGVGTVNGGMNMWKAVGSDFGRNPYGGWQNIAVDPTFPPDYVIGTPGTQYRWFGSLLNMVAAVSKGNLHGVDAIRYGRAEYIVEDGDVANGYATFVGMATTNDSINNRWGLFQEIAGGFLWKGLMSLGTAGSPTQAVNFVDENRVISVDDTPRTYRNFNKIEIKNADSLVSWTNIQITALGTLARGNFEVIDNAIINKDTCIFTDMGTFKYLSNSTLVGTTYRRCDAITQNGATFTSCVFVDHQASTGSPATLDAALLADNLTAITFCDFIGAPAGSPAGVGHAIEITTAAAVGSPTSFDLTGNTFTNFGADGTTDAAIYNNSGTQIILNILSGDTPTILNGTGSSTIVNNSVTLLVQGMTEGAAVKIIADETVGTITVGDIILEVLADANGEATTTINYESAFDPTGLDVIARVRSSGLPTAAIQDDNGAFTDETTAANSAVDADMNLLPTTPVVNQDRYLFGHAEMFNNMQIGINTAGTGGFTITWQYWNGAWTNLTGVVDDTSSFSVAGTNYVRFTMPGDWATTTINGQGPYYYIRAAYTAGTVTVVPLGTRCSLDVTKYLPFVQDGTVTTAGLTVTASWNEDTIATF